MKVYGVGELTRTIKSLLEENLPLIWVEGEISEYLRHRSGHHYFTLKDADAVLSCVIWRGMAESISFNPQPGMKVIVKGRITVYEKGGKYQLEAYTLQLTGEGELMAAFERLKSRLAEEGLFDPLHKKSLPRYPRSIGLVTSPTGAAIRDLVTVARRRNPAVELILAPVKVQGEGAAREIAQAIEVFNRFGRVDLLIVGRGGGSLEDLWAFNEEIVARAIFASRIPIVSAVGHEIDFSIADFTADLRAPTPSAAAEIAVPAAEEIAASLSLAGSRMKNILLNRVRALKDKLEWAKRSRAFGRPREMLREYSQRLDESRRWMESTINEALTLRRSHLERQAASLRALDPRNVLKRGYSVVRRLPENIVVADAAALQRGDKVSMTFHHGNAMGRIEKTETDTLPLQ